VDVGGGPAVVGCSMFGWKPSVRKAPFVGVAQF
jgi:hypothetical protein